VAAYEQVAGESNDVVKLYINPDPTLTAAEQTNVIVSLDLANDYSSDSGILPLRNNITQRGHTAEIGGIRVGKVWKEVLQGAAVTGVSLDQETLTLDVGASATLVATVAPEDAGDASVSWSTSNEAAAIVTNGVVVAIAEGTATITATTTDGSFTADCAVTVNDPTGIFELSAASISIYPNPSSDVFNVENCQGANISVYSITGQEIYNKANVSDHEVIGNDFAQGVYIIHVEKDEIKVSKRLVVR